MYRGKRRFKPTRWLVDMMIFFLACASPSIDSGIGDGCSPTPEIPYDGVDQDCDGTDLDDQDADGVPYPQDCNDTDPEVSPGATDIPYDGIDQDCDGEDRDDLDGDGSPYALDCDDANPIAFPGNPEVCDGVDNDCNGDIDSDAVNRLEWPVDLDGDGFAGSLVLDCFEQGFEELVDCDDTDTAVNPDATETCSNAIDDNCDGYVDEMLVGSTHKSIEGAISDICQDGDTVWVGSGTWYETLTIDRPLVLRGEDQGTSIIDGSRCSGGECTLLTLSERSAGTEVRELTLQHGFSDSVVAAAIEVDADDIHLEELLFQYNIGGFGTGVGTVAHGNLTIYNSTFQFQSGGGASGVYLGQGIHGVVIDGCTFDQNSADFGAILQAAYHDNIGEYSVIVRNSTITNNSSSGIVTSKGDWTLENTTISGNVSVRSGYAGGLHCTEAFYMQGNTISGNSPSDVSPSLAACTK